MAFPFGGHPNLATYIVWLQETHQGTSQSGFGIESLTMLSLPNGRSVIIVGTAQAENLAPSTVAYLDRRLGVTSPWHAEGL